MFQQKFSKKVYLIFNSALCVKKAQIVSKIITLEGIDILSWMFLDIISYTQRQFLEKFENFFLTFLGSFGPKTVLLT